MIYVDEDSYRIVIEQPGQDYFEALKIDELFANNSFAPLPAASEVGNHTPKKTSEPRNETDALHSNYLDADESIDQNAVTEIYKEKVFGKVR